MKSFIATQYVPAINNLKKGIELRNNTFTKQFFMEGLSNLGLPKCDAFWGVWVNSGIILKVNKNKYKFATSNPIDIPTFDLLIRRYKDKSKQYAETRRKKISSVPVAEVITSETKEQEAIKYLKSLGYIIYRVEYKEV